MSYTTPRTYVAAEVHTAAHHNTYQSGNIGWLGTDAPNCRVHNSTNQNLTTSTDTWLTYDSERFDNATLHSTSTNTSRLTCPSGAAGKYLVGCAVDIGPSASGLRYCGITKAHSVAAGLIADIAQSNHGASVTNRFAISTLWDMIAADYLEVRAWQDSGGTLTANGTSKSWGNEFWMIWIHL